jgi:hypothetical protein
MPTRSYPINATSDWTYLFGLAQGETGTLTAAGSWGWDQSANRCGPGGNGQPAPGGCPTAGPEGSLDWRVVTPPTPNSLTGVVGGVAYMTFFSYDTQSYPINVSGNYEFRMNDNVLGDNQGSLTVTVVTP